MSEHFIFTDFDILGNVEVFGVLFRVRDTVVTVAKRMKFFIVIVVVVVVVIFHVSSTNTTIC